MSAPEAAKAEISNAKSNAGAGPSTRQGPATGLPVRDTKKASQAESTTPETKPGYERSTELVSIILTAIATAVMAIFTALLWWSTNKLWQETRRTGETAEKAADAATKSADAARNEFVTTHRPRIILRDAFAKQGDHGDLVEVQLVLANVGETPCRLLASAVRLDLVKNESFDPEQGPEPQEQEGDVRIMPVASSISTTVAPADGAQTTP